MFKTEDRRETPLIAAAGGLAFGAMAILTSMIDNGRLDLVERSAPTALSETIDTRAEAGTTPVESALAKLPTNSAPRTAAAAETSPNVAPPLSRERLKTNLRVLFWLVLALLTCGLALMGLLADTRRKARFASLTDELTRLPNRRAFGTSIAEYYAGIGERNDTEAAMLLFDLDNFKIVNDEHGHEGGDQLLRAFAERMSGTVGKGHLLARIGGDEFAIAFIGKGAEGKARLFADELIVLNEKPYEILGRSLVVGTSIGGVFHRGDLKDVPAIMRRADVALYHAKANNRSRVCYYDETMELAESKRAGIVRDLRSAIANGELSLHFQPIVELEDQRLVCFEALLRWRHPERGFVSPADFIPLAEDSGLIIPIGLWVINEACAVAATWPEELRFTVNLSPRQFGDEFLVPTVQDALERNGVDPARLTLEITETAIVENDTTALSALQALRAMGIKIALDDFGTGFASLSYLTRFPFDVVKIDQSFVREANRNDNADAIIASICDLAARLGLETVAEGIESAEHLKLVQEAGCKRGQGYLFGKPEPADDCATRIALETLRQISSNTHLAFRARSKTG